MRAAVASSCSIRCFSRSVSSRRVLVILIAIRLASTVSARSMS